MNSLRPNSVCDTTPLQRLESQSSCSEPSSPTLNGATLASASVSAGLCVAAMAAVNTATKSATVGPVSGSASTTSTALLANGNASSGSGNNYLGPNGCGDLMGRSSGGSGISASPSTTTTASTASTTLSSLSNHNNNNNNNKNEKSLNIYINSGVDHIGGGGGGGVGGGGVRGIGGDGILGQKHNMELYGTRKICCRILVDFVLLACGKFNSISLSVCYFKTFS